MSVLAVVGGPVELCVTRLRYAQIHGLLYGQKFTAQRRPTTYLLVPASQSGHHNRAQRPAIRLSLTGHQSCRATDRRHHIPKMSFKVRNWPAYKAGLRQRDSLSLWIEDTALECWQTIGPSGQARYTGAAIQTSLMLRAAFKLPLRQIEGLMTSVLSLMGLTISAPDHTTVSRRAVTLPVIQAPSVPHGPLHVLIDSTGLQVYGAGQWLEAKHGAKSRRKWRKLHLAVDGASGMIVAQTLTDQDADDPSQVGPLLDHWPGNGGRCV
jgi:hypothetical protein